MPSIQTDGIVATVGATTQTVASTPIDPNRSVFVEGWAIGRDLATGETCAFKANAVGKTVGGVASLVGAVLLVLSRSDAALAAATATFAVNAGQLQIRVTGVAGRTLQWYGEMSINLVG